MTPSARLPSVGGTCSAPTQALVCAVTAVAALLLDWGSLAMSREPGEVASIWPGDAVVLVLMLSLGGGGAGLRFAAGALGALGAEYLWGDPGLVPAGLVTANFTGIAIVYVGVRAMGGVDLRRARQVLAFLALAVIGAVISGAVGALVLHWQEGSALEAVWLRWTMGDALGYAILAPPLMILTAPRTPAPGPRLPLAQAAWALLGYTALVAAVFAQTRFQLLFLIPLGLFLVAYLMEPEGVMVAILITVVLSMTFSLFDRGAAALVKPASDRLVLVQCFLAAITFSFLPISAVLSERRRLEEALREARAQAEAASALKSEFLATISHELRTPLASILGFAGMLRNRVGLGAEEQDYAESIAVAGLALLTTANDLLAFSELEVGRLDIRPGPHNLTRSTHDAATLFRSAATAKGLRLSTIAADTVPAAVMVDGERVRQVLVNLVANAIKFTDSGAVTIRLDYDLEAQVARLAVEDTGPGVAADQVALMFDRFSQADATMRRRHGGAGLGLAICKELVEAMGGAIGVSSAPGEGTTVHFSLPAPAAEPTAGRR